MFFLFLLPALPAVSAAALQARVEVYPADACPQGAGTFPITCSLLEAARWLGTSPVPGWERPQSLCLHNGVHRLTDPVRLTAAHSNTVWSACDGGSTIASDGNGTSRGVRLSGSLALPAARRQACARGRTRATRRGCPCSGSYFT